MDVRTPNMVSLRMMVPREVGRRVGSGLGRCGWGYRGDGRVVVGTGRRDDFVAAEVADLALDAENHRASAGNFFRAVGPDAPSCTGSGVVACHVGPLAEQASLLSNHRSAPASQPTSCDLLPSRSWERTLATFLRLAFFFPPPPSPPSCPSRALLGWPGWTEVVAGPAPPLGRIGVGLAMPAGVLLDPVLTVSALESFRGRSSSSLRGEQARNKGHDGAKTKHTMARLRYMRGAHRSRPLL